MTLKNKKIGFFFFSLLLLACNKDSEEINMLPVDSNTTEKLEPLTKLPADISKLFIEKGDVNANKVMLYLNGGPVPELDTTEFDDFKLAAYHEVYVYQANTYNKTFFAKAFSFEQAKVENEVTVDIVVRVAKYFKDKGKEVYVIGHSFGAFIIPALLEKEVGKNTITKYLMMAGRLDMNDEVWKGFRDGIPYTFEDGEKIKKEMFPDTATQAEIDRQKLIMKLQAGFGERRNTKLLASIDMSNVIVAYGKKDVAIGRLTEEEISFLTKKVKAGNIYATEGGHSSMFDEPHKTRLVEKLLE